MPLAPAKPSPVRFVAALSILGAHVGVLAVMMNFHSRSAAEVELQPVAVRLIAESTDRTQWQPPKITPVVPVVTTRTPDIPMIEMPVEQSPSNTAITLPAFTSAPRPTQQTGDVAKLVAAVEYLREPEPRYPPQSRKLREQGLVVLRVLIDERGTACDVSVERSSGYERLDRAAREAIARAEFRPYLEDGIARRALVLIPIEFSLNRVAARVASNGA